MLANSQNDRLGELCGLVRALCVVLGAPSSELPASSGVELLPLDTRRYLAELSAADLLQREDTEADLSRILNR